MLLVIDPAMQERLIEERRLAGSDRWDEVWDGTYVLNPLPNIEHQAIIARLLVVFMEILGWDSDHNVYPGVNVSDRVDDWKNNLRCPDVVIYLSDTTAVSFEDFWHGGPDLAIEIVTPEDRTREKIPFYEKVATRELWILDRDPWQLEQLTLENGRLVSQGKSTPDSIAPRASRVLPVTLRVVAGDPRPQIEVVWSAGNRSWLA